MIHAEKDELKSENESAIDRIKGELEDFKSEILVKEKMIEKLTQSLSNRLYY